MVRQHLSMGSGGSLPTVAMRVAKDEGFKGLYRGYSAAILREMTYSSLRFGLYEPIKTVLGATDPQNTPFYKKIFAGLSAGAFAAALASPTDMLKIRIQKQTSEFRGMLSRLYYPSPRHSQPVPRSLHHHRARHGARCDQDGDL
jgi:hypothetical protein